MQRNAVGMGKRTLEGGEDEQPERKRPALASVILEAFKEDILQKLSSSVVPKLCSSLEPILHRVVSEEVERALAKLGPARLSGRSPPKMTEGPDGRNLQLHFRSRLSLPLFTRGKVEGEQGAAIDVVLIDANTGNVVTSGPEAATKLDVVVLEGDFNNEDDEGWTQEEFESHVVREREGKRPLLTGDLQVKLKEGVGTLGDLTFTDNSSWMKNRKFRLGLKVASGFCESIRIREAKTEAFTVKHDRGELYKKHYPPALNDDIWRLEKIGKDGLFQKKLNSAGIFTVEDFLRLVVKDQQKLRNILGSGMSDKMWDALLEHARACSLSRKLYVYYTEDTRNVGVVFNNICELRGLISGEQFYSADSLSDSQKLYVDSFVKKAYDNWDQVVEYDGKTLLPGNGLDHQQPQSALPVSAPSEQQLNSGLLVGGYNDALAITYPTLPLISNSNSRNQFDSSSFVSQDQLISNHQPQSSRNDHGAVGLALGPPKPSPSGFHVGSSSIQPAILNPFEEWSHNRDRGVDEFLSGEEIRIRSHEMLENEDMQQLLRIFSTGDQEECTAGYVM
ncbi:hypothetical protein K1719_011529 [Acacia pycnantha]|nr:hypothetical protein K1719_011529 [Acacia pycnantha]